MTARTRHTPGEPGVQTTELGGKVESNSSTEPRRGRELIEDYVAAGWSRNDLCVMDPGNDPFNVGTPAQRRDAGWFAELYAEHVDPFSRVHLRRIHYRILGEVLLPDGSTYQNTERCWKRLLDASKLARTLGLVDPRLIEDRRNPETEVYWRGDEYEPIPAWWLDGEPSWRLPLASTVSPASIALPDIEVDGYEWGLSDHPVQLELYVEKSTMNDVLEPICQRRHVNLTGGAGYTSHTRIMEMITRARRHSRPLRILCITDFDPAGHAMPTALARVVQYALESERLDLDVAVDSIALTAEQCVEYELPRIPIKETDRRKGSFEERFGEGATELDAIEGRHPGALEALVNDAVARYRDPDHESRLHETGSDALQVVQAAVEDATGDIVAEVQSIHDEAREALDRLNDAIEPAVHAYTDEVAPHRERLEELRRQYLDVVGELDVQLPERDVARAPGLESDGDWMFRSDRDFLTQLGLFKRHQRREVPR